MVEAVRLGYIIEDFYWNKKVYKDDDIYVVLIPMYDKGVFYDYHTKEYTKVEDAVKEFVK